MGRISWEKAAKISEQMGDQGMNQSNRLKAKAKIPGTDCITLNKWCDKCAFEKSARNVGPCAFCRTRPQITPTHYKRRKT